MNHETLARRGVLLALLVLVAAPSIVRAQHEDVPLDVPPVEVNSRHLDGPLFDSAAVLTGPGARELRWRLLAFEEATTAQIAVLTTPSLAGRSIEDYATRTFSRIGLGRADVNNGLLIIIAPNERTIRIEVGLGLERQVSDADAARVIELMMPFLMNEDFAGGVGVALDTLEPLVASVTWNVSFRDPVVLENAGEAAVGLIAAIDGTLSGLEPGDSSATLDAGSVRIALNFPPHWWDGPMRSKEGERITLFGRTTSATPLAFDVLGVK